MRGIEAALQVCMEVSAGAFASESLRKLYPDIVSGDRDVAALLTYCTLRRQGLWKHLMLKYCKRNARELSYRTQTALIIGIAGLVELKHFAAPVLINAILQAVKASGREKDIADVPVVHAVLRSISENARPYLEKLKKSSLLSDLSLYYGVPGWAAAQWSRERSISEAKQLVHMMGMKPYLSIRLSKSLNVDEWIAEYKKKCGRKAWKSDFLGYSVRTASTAYPPNLPAYREGLACPQTESSMFVVEAFCKKYKGGAILDMCSGRGVKTRQLADLLPEAQIEAWDISDAKLQTAKLELMKMYATDRVKLRKGDARILTPRISPSAILLDAPCSGSGTWGRHPEGKWKMKPEELVQNAQLQYELLEYAVEIVESGGIIAYTTCSGFRTENEEVIAKTLAKHPEIVELPIRTNSSFMHKGKPYGTLINPVLPWVDGFFVTILMKRK